MDQPAVPARLRENAEPAAWTMALLWLVHPLQTETVICVIQRTEIMGGLFYLLALYAFIRATETTGRLWLLLAVTACVLGVASKEIIATLPLLALLYDRTFASGTFRAAWAQRRGLYLALASTWLLLAGLTWVLMTIAYELALGHCAFHLS